VAFEAALTAHVVDVGAAVEKVVEVLSAEDEAHPQMELATSLLRLPLPLLPPRVPSIHLPQLRVMKWKKSLPGILLLLVKELLKASMAAS